MFQVVVEVFGEATAVVVMFIPFADPSDYPSISSLSISIYMMATIMTGIPLLMAKQTEAPETTPAWLVMLKAWQSIGRYLRPTMSAEGLGESDFRVLEVLLHKGPMPVNAIGPKVDLNPGSVSVAVDRLYKRGLVSRVESAHDRRVRTVTLTEKGKKMFLPLFRRHTTLIKRAFQDVSPEELQQFEAVLKKVGKRSESLAENPRAIVES